MNNRAVAVGNDNLHQQHGRRMVQRVSIRHVAIRSRRHFNAKVLNGQIPGAGALSTGNEHATFGMRPADSETARKRLVIHYHWVVAMSERLTMNRFVVPGARPFRTCPVPFPCRRFATVRLYCGDCVLVDGEQMRDPRMSVLPCAIVLCVAAAHARTGCAGRFAELSGVVG